MEGINGRVENLIFAVFLLVYNALLGT
jgi:hypothetical protein